MPALASRSIQRCFELARVRVGRGLRRLPQRPPDGGCAHVEECRGPSQADRLSVRTQERHALQSVPERRRVQYRVPSAPRRVVGQRLGSAAREARRPEPHRLPRDGQALRDLVNGSSVECEQDDAAAADQALRSGSGAHPSLEQVARGRIWRSRLCGSFFGRCRRCGNSGVHAGVEGGSKSAFWRISCPPHCSLVWCAHCHSERRSGSPKQPATAPIADGRRPSIDTLCVVIRFDSTLPRCPWP
jgi:hypothetical protein